MRNESHLFCAMTTLSYNVYSTWLFVCLCLSKKEKNRERLGRLCCWSRLVLARTPGICFGWLLVNVCTTLCSAGYLFKDTVESLFVKVYYKGRPEGVCHNEVV